MLSRRAFRYWFLAAAIYNITWGTWTGLFPEMYFRWLGMTPPLKPIWQCVGMIVGVYGLGYYFIYRQPERYAALAYIGLLGKVLGPLGFGYAVLTSQLPAEFGYMLIANDLIWWPVFTMFLLKYGKHPFQSCGQSMERGEDRLS